MSRWPVVLQKKKTKPQWAMSFEFTPTEKDQKRPSEYKIQLNPDKDKLLRKYKRHVKRGLKNNTLIHVNPESFDRNRSYKRHVKRGLKDNTLIHVNPDAFYRNRSYKGHVKRGLDGPDAFDTEKRHVKRGLGKIRNQKPPKVLLPDFELY